MDKKKVLILISSLFLLVLIIAFSIIGISNTTNNTRTKNDNNHINTSQIQGGTNYNHNDTQSEYDKMVKEAKEQEKLAKIQQEKKTKEEKEGKKEQEENNETTRKIKENGITYITNDSGIKIPEGVAGTAPVKTKRLPDSEAFKNEKPFYDKYIREVPESTLKRKTQETKILHKYLRGNDLIITSIDVSTKGNRAAIAYQKNKQGGIETALVSILNQAGTAKKEHLNNLHYTVNFDVDYIDKNTTNCYKIVKALGMPIKENEFANLYKKYKYGKLTDDDYKKPYSIGFNEIEVVIEW